MSVRWMAVQYVGDTLYDRLAEYRQAEHELGIEVPLEHD